MAGAFKGQVVWITGASSGIGEALAKELAGQGARLVLSARRQAELERVRDACGGHNAPVVLLPLDVADTDSAPQAVARALEAFGRVDMLVNNAGISQRSLARDTSLEVDRRIMEVNFFGTVALTKALLPHLVTQGSGRLVAISSIVGKFGSPLRSAYSASKHALHGFFDSLRAELAGTGVQVTLVCPGFIRTEVSANALTGDGSAQGFTDPGQANGMDPAVFARHMLDALARGEREVVIGGKEAQYVRIKRFFPDLFARLLEKANVR
ncbi:SDR family oxidoreductase [Aerophototrophica crusticola]|uniref:SDR family oxidoreductase n=1 Tax=Aerophototrophica crusticola TaxID=1709002 RepID=A0A858R8Z9_9PROT|nr:SDR family oxidoreductase [Rhodospirillaceae bacterium B3]